MSETTAPLLTMTQEQFDAVYRDDAHWKFKREIDAQRAARARALGTGADWQPIETAPRVHPLNDGRDLLLAWVAPGIGEWVVVVGHWRDGWWTGEHKAFPTHWMYAPDPPRALAPSPGDANAD